ncbi:MULTISPECIES: SusC/RagA family TonB-linked outer membrane protein [Spirosoma]|uniref:SusC/RagA family TonB-linked outer membrane protein n=1 Tax=Spirosoma sordidisoli TaxID=2502893 RepID=A0A4Q2UDW3_9BACT|nr:MULTISPECIES: SusC/RagA family TonB-linked outer membrane protein [Spirosoma]RYC67144.1 SusC/RagA family TonB-linked outer membrane protein [Spirosoma sordidisoli]
MKKVFILFVLLFISCLSSPLLAQSRVVKGRVLSTEDNSALPGVNVAIKGTTIGASTNSEGNYSISIPTEHAAGTLVFSFIGMKTTEVVIGNQSTISVSLIPGETSLSEVVVSALGFKENADKLGATAAKIDAKDIVRSGETGVINGMAGKAAGVQITRSAGDPGAGSYIQIRGQNTITGSTQPLVIVDGIPISNSTLGDGVAGVSQQSRLNDINPNDIASMQILKGASAAALWGSRAANGVIVITTKKGANTDKVNIALTSAVSFDQPNLLHPMQSTYGQGAGGVYSPTGSFTWGDRIADRSGAADEVNQNGPRFEADNGQIFYPIIRKNSRETFNDVRRDQVFRTGTYIDNNLSVSGGNDKGNFYLSVGDLRQQGILNGQSDYKRTTVRFNTERRFNNIFKATTNATYARTTSNRVQRSNSVAGLYIGMLRTPPDYDNRGYKGNYFASPTASPIPNRQRSFRNYLGASANPVYNDPLWAINEMTNTTEVDRFILSSELLITPASWFDITARGGLDSYTDLRLTNSPVSSAVNSGLGSLEQQMLKETEMNMDVIGRVFKDIGKNITSTLILGFNINDRKYLSLGGTLNTFIIPDAPPNFTNALAANRVPYNTTTHRRTARAYSSLNLGFFDQLFVNASLAGEAGSTFGSESQSTFYYPSADVAWQFTKLPLLSSNKLLSFGKLRASYGTVGVQPDAYRNTTTFVNASFGSWGGPVSGTGYGNGAFVQSNRQGDPNLRPERKTEYEVGTDLRFMNDKLSVGFTYYQNKIVDLLLDVATAGSTGFTQKYTNAGTMENKGLELELNYNVMSRGSFNWNLFTNLSRNRNRVLDLAGTDNITLGGFSSTASTVAKVGYAMSSLYGGVYQRNEAGALVLNANGFPQIASSFGVLGDPNPDWRGGFGTNLSFKGVSLNVLFETSQGGDFYNGTRGVMYHFGTHQDVGYDVTLGQPLKNYAGKTIAAGTTVRGAIKDFGAGPVLLDESYYTSIGGGFSTLVEQFISDGSWTRLREVSVGYSLNSASFRQKTRLQSINFTLTGRNPILWTNVVGIDPETGLNGTGNSRGQDYFNSPNTKSLLFSIKINY